MTGVEAAIFVCKNALSFKEGFAMFTTAISLILAGYAIMLSHKSISDAKSFKADADRVNANTAKLLLDIKDQAKFMTDWGMERIKSNDEFKEKMLMSVLNNKMDGNVLANNKSGTNKKFGSNEIEDILF